MTFLYASAIAVSAGVTAPLPPLALDGVAVRLILSADAKAGLTFMRRLQEIISNAALA